MPPGRKTGGMEVRERTVEDLGELETIARQVRRFDGYPIFLPRNDVRRFLERPEPLAAWVAVERDSIIGHVTLNASSSAPVMQVRGCRYAFGANSSNAMLSGSRNSRMKPGPMSLTPPWPMPLSSNRAAAASISARLVTAKLT